MFYASRGGYLAATQHPWPCFIFLLPLLAAYEAGVFWLGGSQPESLRNGADTWLHWGLDACGLSHFFWAPLLIMLLFYLWSWLRWWDRPDGMPGVCCGMIVESALFGFGLLGVSRILNPTLQSFGVVFAAGVPSDQTVSQVITFVGAGIYEEVLFRLILFGGAVRFLQLLTFPWLMAVGIAAVGSSLLFSAAHHAGPCGEPFDDYVFLFRTVAGLYFTAVFQLRGFGVAVGAHAAYDVLAGIMVA